MVNRIGHKFISVTLVGGLFLLLFGVGMQFHSANDYDRTPASKKIDCKTKFAKLVTKKHENIHLTTALLSFILKGIGHLGKLTFYPTIFPFSVYRLKKEFGLLQIPYELIKKDGAYIGVFAAVYAATNGKDPAYLVSNYLLGTVVSLESLEDEYHINDSGQVVFVNLHSGAGFKKLKEEYISVFKSEKSHMITPTSYFELINELRRIFKEYGQISHLNIAGHGIPGVLSFKTTALRSEDLTEKINEIEHYNFMSFGARITFSACMLGATPDSYFKHDGKEFLNLFAHLFLPNGGSIMAPNKVVYMKASAHSISGITDSFQLYRDLALSPMSFSLFIAYENALKDKNNVTELHYDGVE